MKNNKQITAKTQTRAERKVPFQAAASPKSPQAKWKQQTPQASAIAGEHEHEEEENDPFNPTPEKPVSSIIQKQPLAKAKRNSLPKAKGRFHPDKTNPDTDADKTTSAKVGK